MSLTPSQSLNIFPVRSIEILRHTVFLILCREVYQHLEALITQSIICQMTKAWWYKIVHVWHFKMEALRCLRQRSIKYLFLWFHILNFNQYLRKYHLSIFIISHIIYLHITYWKNIYACKAVKLPVAHTRNRLLPEGTNWRFLEGRWWEMG